MAVRLLLLLIIVVASVLAISCGGPPSTSAEGAGDGALPLSWETLDSFDFEVAAADYPLQIQARELYELLYFSRHASAGGRVGDSAIKFFRDSIMIDTLVSLTAPGYDLRQHWYQHREYRQRYNGVLRKTFWDNEVATRITLDSQEVVDYYNANLDKFSYPEQVDIYHILSSPLGFRQGPDSVLVDHFTREDLSDFAGEFIQNLYQMLMYGDAFENVAFNYSHDVLSRERGGQLGWTVRGQYLDPFDSVAFGLEDGEFSKPYQDTDGWHMLYRERYNPGGPHPLDSPRVYIESQQAVFDAKAGALAAKVLDSINQTTVLVTNEEFLNGGVIYDLDDSMWVAIVNDADTVDCLAMKGKEEDFRRGYRVASTTPEMRKNMIATAIGPIRIQQAAIANGFDTLPVLIESRDNIWRETVKSIRLSHIYGREAWEVPDSLIEQYYEDHWDEFNPENHIKVEQLLVKDVELAYFLKEQANQGLDFKYLTNYYNEDGYDVKYEDLGIIDEDKIDPALYSALLATHAPRTTKVVETKRGFHIARVLDRSYQRPLQMARSEIRATLTELHRWRVWAKRRDQLFEHNGVTFPENLPEFNLPRLSERNHPRTFSKPANAGR